jgi:hypothetical protein
MDIELAKIPLGHVDVSRLSTDDDVRSEAARQLPGFLARLGEAAGKVFWERTQASLKGVPGMKLNTSSGDKQRFIREAGQNYVRQMSAAEKKKVEAFIVEAIQRLKASGG